MRARQSAPAVGECFAVPGDQQRFDRVALDVVHFGGLRVGWSSFFLCVGLPHLTIFWQKASRCTKLRIIFSGGDS